MKLIDFRHVAEQDVFLVEQSAGDERSHRGVVHLRCIALKFGITHTVCQQISNVINLLHQLMLGELLMPT